MGKKRKMPGLNTSSTADISFMLLIFFLVTTSMDTDQGLGRTLPKPPEDDQLNNEIKVKERNILNIRINKDNYVMIGDDYASLSDVKERAKEFIKNENNRPNLPELKPKKTLYAFGYGLSYTTFDYGEGKLSKSSMKKDGKVTITVPVKNTGKVAGAEIVQVYVQSLDNPEAPIKALQGFAKLQLAPGQSGKARITLDGEAFSFYDEAVDGLSVYPGRYRILYGSSSRDEDLQSIDFQVI